MATLTNQTALSGGSAVDDIDIEAEQRRAASQAAIDPTEKQNIAPEPEVVKEVVEEPAKTTEVEKPITDTTKVDDSDDSDTTFDAFLAAKAGLPVVTKPADAKPTDVKPVATAPEARKLDDIEPEFQPYFKQMSNDAFNKMKALYLERKQAQEELAAAKQKSGIPENYYEHELAYVLTPEFAQQSERANAAATVLSHWKQQLQAVRGGADEYQRLEVDEKTGQFRLSAPVKVDRNTLTELEDVRSWAQDQYSQLNGELQAFVKTHQSKSGEVKNWLNEFEARAFPVFKDKKELQPLVEDTVKKTLHPAFHNNPVSRLFGMAVIIMGEQAKLIKDFQAKTANGAPAPKTQRQPSAAEIAGGGSTKPKTTGISDENLDDAFAKAKAGLPL